MQHGQRHTDVNDGCYGYGTKMALDLVSVTGMVCAYAGLFSTYGMNFVWHTNQLVSAC